MSVTIRLARIGKRNAPAYKVVVANTRDKRNGRFLDVLGHYNPSHTPPLLSIDKKKYKEWKGKGALSTDAVEKLIAGKYEFVPYTRQNEEKKEKKEVEETSDKKTPDSSDKEGESQQEEVVEKPEKTEEAAKSEE